MRMISEEYSRVRVSRNADWITVRDDFGCTHRDTDRQRERERARNVC